MRESIKCPVAECIYDTQANIDPVVVAALLTIHVTTHSNKVEKIRRRIQLSLLSVPVKSGHTSNIDGRITSTRQPQKYMALNV